MYIHSGSSIHRLITAVTKMTSISVLFALFFALLFSKMTNSARILGVFQMPAVSHQCVFQPIWKELSLRGHDVTVITPHPIKDPSLVNLTEIDTSFTYEIINRHGFEFFMSKELPVQSKIPKIFDMYYEFAETIFNLEEFKKIYNNPDEKFDLIIAQIYVNPIMFALSEKFKAPVIGMSSMGGWIGTHFSVGNPHPPSIYSEMFLHYNGKLTFYERLKSTLYYLWARLYIQFVSMPKCDAIARKYLGNDLPYLADIERNVSALLLSINPILYTARPNVPTIVPLTFMHIKPPKALPKDLQNLMDNAKNGIVYFSLGSNVKSVHMPEGLRQTIIDTFAELPYTILWKWESDELPGKPDNVIVRKWLPQQDVLAHPNVKAFISQCGLQSTEEAISRGVPMVGMPFIADQEMNARRLEEREVALAVDYVTLTKDELKRVIVEVVTNDMYRKNMMELRELLYDQPMTSLERAVWWAEYVIRHKGTKHLRSPTADISWLEYLLIDVIGVILLTIFIVAFIVYKTVKILASRCRTGKKIKSN